MNIKLGTINELSLKSVWPLEEKHFTPWLSKNLDVLGEVLGFDLECLETELRAGEGQRHVDMLAEINGKDLVVIENQYGKADPSHGWRTLHYSISLGAKVAIWIFEDISSDDERLISFLNDHPGIDIIGVQAKVYQIDNSLPAITFEVIPVSRNALYSVQKKAVLNRSISSKESFYGEFFPSLINHLSLGGISRGRHGHGHGTPNYHCDWPSPYGGLNKIEAAFRQGRGESSYRVQLKLSDKDTQKVVDNFEYLKRNKSKLIAGIEKDVDCNFYFKENRKMQFIEFYFPHPIDVEECTGDEVGEIMDWTKKVVRILNSNLSDLKRSQVLLQHSCTVDGLTATA